MGLFVETLRVKAVQVRENLFHVDIFRGFPQCFFILFVEDAWSVRLALEDLFDLVEATEKFERTLLQDWSGVVPCLDDRNHFLSRFESFKAFHRYERVYFLALIFWKPLDVVTYHPIGVATIGETIHR